MNNNITLNASMRSNLLSLRNISKQMDKTQLILATGEKVNSAIDNASAYYQARSLTNRAADLTALLDAMGQGIQTIESANAGLEKAQDMLGLAGATINNITSQIAGGDIFAVAANKEELLAAIESWESGDGLIVISQDIDMGNTRLELKDNQKLVGLNYVDGSAQRAELTFNFLAAENTDGNAIICGDNNMLADLKITYSSDNADIKNTSFNAINNNGGTLKLHNVDLSIDNTNEGSGNNGAMLICGIYNQNGGNINLSGNNLFNSSSKKTYGLALIRHQDTSCRLLLESGASLDVTNKGTYNRVIYSGTNIFLSDVIIDARSGNTSVLGQGNFAFYGDLIVKQGTATASLFGNSNVDIFGNASINLGGHNNAIFNNSEINVYGSINIKMFGGSSGIPNRLLVDKASLTIKSGACLMLEQVGTYAYISNAADNKINLEQGAKIGVVKENVGVNALYLASQNTSYTTKADEILEDFAVIPDLKKIGDFPQADFDEDMTKLDEEIAAIGSKECASTLNDAKVLSNYQQNLGQNGVYKEILEQYDKLISDSSYQGVNLLKGGNLRLTFDENREHKFEVLGEDISALQIGLDKDEEWKNLSDVRKILSSLQEAITTLRSFAEELGNNYSIIKTRINFTEALSDVLETGADDLTLADMNEASAEYLTLQTRQQLAINSLSLASQSAQSVLSLF